MNQITEKNVMEAIPLVKETAAIMVREMKKKHFDQVQSLKIQWDEPMPEHEVLGIVATVQNDWIVCRVGSGIRKLWVEDYMAIALGMKTGDNDKEWFATKRQILNETPQLFTS